MKVYLVTVEDHTFGQSRSYYSHSTRMFVEYGYNVGYDMAVAWAKRTAEEKISAKCGKDYHYTDDIIYTDGAYESNEDDYFDDYELGKYYVSWKIEENDLSGNILVVSAEDFAQRGWVGKLDKKKFERMCKNVARYGLNNNDSVMECFWLAVDAEAEKKGLKNGDGKLYAMCKIRWKDTGEVVDRIIKTNEEFDPATDEKVFFGCNGLETLQRMCFEDSGEDFVIEEIVEFSDEI